MSEELPGQISADLLASMVHDLRSPLAGAVALLDLLAGEADGPMNDAQKLRVVRLQGAVGKLTAVVEGIAQLAQAESGRLVLAPGPLDLAEVARNARQQIEPLLRSRAVSLDLALPPDLPPLLGDPQRVRQLIVSWVTGMARQLEGTTLEMAATHRGALVEITLREAARGLPVEALPAAFDQSPSAGAEAPSRQGVSLSLARALAALHGGSLRMGRDEEGGLIASLSLPAASPDSHSRAERPIDLRTTT
jgi:signal transduction histidine kinase